MKPGDLVRITGTDIKLKVLSKDDIASRVFNKTYWTCRKIGRSCIDSYPEDKLTAETTGS